MGYKIMLHVPIYKIQPEGNHINESQALQLLQELETSMDGFENLLAD